MTDLPRDNTDIPSLGILVPGAGVQAALGVSVGTDNTTSPPTSYAVLASGGMMTQGYVAANSANPVATSGGSEYQFKWGTNTAPITVNHVMIQNKTTAVLYFELDNAVTVGSPTLASGGTTILILHVPVTVLHILTAANQNVNGSSDNNVIIRGWM